MLQPALAQLSAWDGRPLLTSVQRREEGGRKERRGAKLSQEPAQAMLEPIDDEENPRTDEVDNDNNTDADDG